jgi:tetratricopeptide (TPR) repeat protein
MRNQIAAVVLISLYFVSGCASSGGSDPQATSQQAGSSQSQTTPTDPLYALTLMRQGSVMMQQGRLNEALSQFQQADRLAPGNATNFNMMGLCYLRLNDFGNALSSFDEALRLVPGFTDARNNRGATYLSMGQYRMAEVDFVAVLGDSTYPYRKQVYFNLGQTYYKRNQLGAAMENFRKAIILPNPVFDAYVSLSEVAQQQGELDYALTLLEEAKLNFPDRLELSLELGKLLILMGDDAEARPHLEHVIADAPGSEAAQTARALLGTG